MSTGRPRLWTAVAILGLAPAFAAAQTLGGGAGEPHISAWRIIGALVLCLLLAVAGAAALRARRAVSGPLRLPAGPWARALGMLVHDAGRDPRLKALQTLRIGAQVEVCLFTLDGAEFLIASGPSGIAMLHRSEKPQTGRPEL